MLVPVMAYYITFHLVPVYGLQIAFKDFNPSIGIWSSDWIGWTYFDQFFSSYYFDRLLWNTVIISVLALVIAFPLPILLALILNEVKWLKVRSFVQNITYFPHFVSVIVVAGMITVFTSPSGVVNMITGWFGMEPTNFLIEKETFRSIYILSEIWQHTGWSAIIYIAALSAINPELYEAATMDGAGKWKKIKHVSFPGIIPTVVVLFILKIGNLLDVGFQKILLLQNDLNLETSDVISTYVYRTGILQGEYSFSTAVGLFNTMVNLILLIVANYSIKRMTNNSLW